METIQVERWKSIKIVFAKRVFLAQPSGSLRKLIVSLGWICKRNCWDAICEDSRIACPQAIQN
ncbi:MAG: hypothetical protein CBD18_08115 [Opitutales bacterium TMED158]|nr:MAG: hypothetical protein CBD18_08115 [Opitutales bacterium TMED158]